MLYPAELSAHDNGADGGNRTLISGLENPRSNL